MKNIQITFNLSVSKQKSKDIEYVNCLNKRRMMSFSVISLITLRSFNRELVAQHKVF